MKPSRKLLSLLASAFALSLFVSGCYTQLATEEEDESSSEARYDVPRSYEEGDTLEPRPSYYDDYDQSRHRHWIGFSFYYPGYWDPFYDPWYWGSSFSYPYSPYYYRYSYGYGYPYGYYGYPYSYYPYHYYTGYPFVVYAGRNQTRESGYRRTGASRVGGYYGSGTTPGASLSIPSASRRSGSGRDAGYSRPSNRSTESSSGRGSSRGYVPESRGRSRDVAPPSRSSAPSARQAPSGGSSRGSSSPSGSTRSSGSSGRSRSYYDSPSGSYRHDAPASRGNTPSYTPSYTPSHSPPPAPSSAPSSGGSQGGTRSGGATRSGRE